ncbi:MAG: diacylglycerol kinase family lipid kinase [Chloroflexota bacterium]|nr:diacylglycerol kinase family lipid kinase [Chloroflexota bacterium]
MAVHHAQVIVNPCAGGGFTGRKWPQIRGLLQDAGLSIEHGFTDGPGHGTDLAREAVERGHELVIAVGGDGTVNEVANGLVDEEGKGRATLGIIGLGTGGDAIRTLGIPRDYVQACHLFSDYRKCTIDLGEVEYTGGTGWVRRLFFNTAGLGFDAATVERQHALPGGLRGTLPYLIALGITLVSYRNKRVTLSVDGQAEERRCFTVVVNNGRYFGGGMKIAPEADVCDGLLDVVVIGDMGRSGILWNLPKVYSGNHIGHPMVSAYRALGVEVGSPERLLLQVDGELVGEAPARFRLLPAALDVAVAPGEQGG